MFDRRSRLVGVLCGVLGAALLGQGLTHSLADAQQPGPGPRPDQLEIQDLNWGNWQPRVGFSQAASVRGPGRWLFLSGAGSEEEQEGEVQYPGDFMAQCRYAWSTINRILEREGGSPSNIVRVVTYVTDPRTLAQNNACKKEVFGDGPYPPHTFLNVSQLAIPGMVIEVEVTAVLPD
ncbi:MAG TPA: RidA family protein [Chloroflexota bacterium]|nr:RidA family protein [Chloroflexota bacterium]